jgi:hypothetical protein
MDDGGYLFFLALVVFTCCVALVLPWAHGRYTFVMAEVGRNCWCESQVLTIT